MDLSQIVDAFSTQGIAVSLEEAKIILPYLEASVGNTKTTKGSQVDFSIIQIVTILNRTEITRLVLGEILKVLRTQTASVTVPTETDWKTYFNQVANLDRDEDFRILLGEKGFHPVRVSWEDLGRYKNSCWGSRISDVSIYVREDEFDETTARHVLSVRRDGNFRDKVLLVPTENIKIHLRENGEHVEKTLRDRLSDLQLLAGNSTLDDHVVVSNQFAVVPVPSRSMIGAWKEDVPPRAAFNFSVYPYGSTNYIITDVIEGSSDAVVSGHTHQYLYTRTENGQKAPFTASRAEDRQDLLKLEADLKAKGMDVNVQRYYLVQIPLTGSGIQAANMGAPSSRRSSGVYLCASAMSWSAPSNDDVVFESYSASEPKEEKTSGGVLRSFKSSLIGEKGSEAVIQLTRSRGVAKVAIGTGEEEGEYNVGSGFEGKRANEPIRVTVAYFVTPNGEVTREDMDSFAAAFEAWDSQAIWGGSFVVDEEKK